MVITFAIGVPTSFIRRRSSLGWEPSDILVMGVIWAVVITIFTVLVAVIMHRYVSLYERGAEAEGRVVSERRNAAARGVVVAFRDAAGLERFAVVSNTSLSVGESTRVIIGPSGSTSVLVRSQSDFRRASALTAEQIQQVPV